ncbi:MAG: hypothetical protein IIT76_07340 [Prevotella sp.]|nr:hypothetical protein [Prevotella sp.]
MKKFSVLVKQVLMSVATAGIFSFSFVFTSCNDDDILESGVTPPDMEQEYNGPLQEPYGLSFYDFVASDDVTILNADTTQISVSKALADKMGIQSFLGHPMGIWDHPEHRAYLRRATKEKLEGDRYILQVIPSSIAEVLTGNDKEYKLSTELYVNTDPASTRTRAIENNTPEFAARYIDEKNVIHPIAITFRRAEGDQRALTRNAAAENGIYGTYLPDQLLGLQDDPATRGLDDDIWNFIKKGAEAVGNWFKDIAVGTAEWFKAQAKAMEKWLKENTQYDINWDKRNTLINIDSKVETKVPIQCGKDSKDTINVYVKAPVKFNLNYTFILQADGSVVEKPNLRRFEASVDGRFNFEPEVRLGFNGKLELPKDKQKIDLVELDGITVVFYIGYVPFCVDFNPSLYLKFKAEVEGKATMGVKYEFDSWFKGGILYEGYGDPRGINESKVTKSKVSFIKPTAEFNASAGVGLMFGCEMIIDKLVGPELAVGPQLKADAGLTLTPFEKDPVNFEASVDFGLTGEVGAKLKVWKWEIAEWNVDLDFGLNWNIYKYPKDNSKGNKNAENRSNDYEVQKNIEEINKQGLKLIEFNERQQLGKKLSEDAEVMEYTNEYLHTTVFNLIPYTKKSQKKAIIRSQLDEFATKYGRAPKNNDADFQTLKSMTLEKIKTIGKKELYKLLQKY